MKTIQYKGKGDAKGLLGLINHILHTEFKWPSNVVIEDRPVFTYRRMEKMSMPGNGEVRGQYVSVSGMTDRGTIACSIKVVFDEAQQPIPIGISLGFNGQKIELDVLPS